MEKLIAGFVIGLFVALLLFVKVVAGKSWGDILEVGALFAFFVSFGWWLNIIF